MSNVSEMRVMLNMFDCGQDDTEGTERATWCGLVLFISLCILVRKKQNGVLLPLALL